MQANWALPALPPQLAQVLPLPSAAGGGSAQAQLQARLLEQPALAGPELAAPRAAVRRCAEQADAALAHLPAEPAALAVLEAMLRFAVRTILPYYPTGGLFCFPWLERAVWHHCPSLRPADAGMPGAAWGGTACSVTSPA